MTIEMLRDVVLSDCGALRVGAVEVPDALAAALIYQGVARQCAPARVAAAVPPIRKMRRSSHVAVTAEQHTD